MCDCTRALWNSSEDSIYLYIYLSLEDPTYVNVKEHCETVPKTIYLSLGNSTCVTVREHCEAVLLLSSITSFYMKLN